MSSEESDLSPNEEKNSFHEVELLILEYLLDKPKYGYEIEKYLRDVLPNVNNLSTGVVYTLLAILEQSGSIISTEYNQKRLFYLTPYGRDLAFNIKSSKDFSYQNSESEELEVVEAKKDILSKVESFSAMISGFLDGASINTIERIQQILSFAEQQIKEISSNK